MSVKEIPKMQSVDVYNQITLVFTTIKIVRVSKNPVIVVLKKKIYLFFSLKMSGL